MTDAEGLRPISQDGYAKRLFKKWLFVPNFSGSILVTDRFNSQHRERYLRPSDFQYQEDAVPNYGMLTYVGISEISKEIDSLRSQVETLQAQVEGMGGSP